MRNGAGHPSHGDRTRVINGQCQFCREATERRDRNRASVAERLVLDDGHTPSLFLLVTGGGV